jgi:hypothetical protein
VLALLAREASRPTFDMSGGGAGDDESLERQSAVATALITEVCARQRVWFPGDALY